MQVSALELADLMALRMLISTSGCPIQTFLQRAITNVFTLTKMPPGIVIWGILLDDSWLWCNNFTLKQVFPQECFVSCQCQMKGKQWSVLPKQRYSVKIIALYWDHVMLPNWMCAPVNAVDWTECTLPSLTPGVHTPLFTFHDRTCASWCGFGKLSMKDCAMCDADESLLQSISLCKENKRDQ